MIPCKNIVNGEIKVSLLIDTRDVQWSPFDLPENTPMINPITHELIGEWENGYHFTKKDVLIKVKNNEIVEMYRLTELTKGQDIII